MATASPGYVLLDEFIPEILQYCNHAPSIMIRTHVLNVTVDFLNKSQILKKSPSNITLGEDEFSYTLKYAGDRYRTIAVDSAKFESSSSPLHRTTEKEMDGEFVNWRAQTSSRPTRYFLEDETNKIRFWPTPSADIDTDIEVVTRVTMKRGETEIDEFIYEKWHDVIQAGVIAKMLKISGSTWYDPAGAKSFEREFSTGIREARKTTLSGTGKYPGRVMPQSFGYIGDDSSGNRSISSWV
jgi:hypothetical protein